MGLMFLYYSFSCCKGMLHNVVVGVWFVCAAGSLLSDTVCHKRPIRWPCTRPRGPSKSTLLKSISFYLCLIVQSWLLCNWVVKDVQSWPHVKFSLSVHVHCLPFSQGPLRFHSCPSGVVRISPVGCKGGFLEYVYIQCFTKFYLTYHTFENFSPALIFVW